MARRRSGFELLGRWVAASAAAGSLYWIMVRPWHMRWGATDEETTRSLPGDDLVPEPRLNTTHAVTISASLDKVWPWILQIGRGRGGFYSYEWIENMMGLDIHNTDRILPEYQDIKVGELIPFAPDGSGIPLAILEPRAAFVLHADTRNPVPGLAIPTQPGEFLNISWGFYLDKIDSRTTRLIERWRVDFTPSLQTTATMRWLMEPGAFLMQRKMLMGIKQRAEAQNATSQG